MCDDDATCNNTVGNYTCDCNDGYEGNGYMCTGKDNHNIYRPENSQTRNPLQFVDISECIHCTDWKTAKHEIRSSLWILVIAREILPIETMMPHILYMFYGWTAYRPYWISGLFLHMLLLILDVCL